MEKRCAIVDNYLVAFPSIENKGFNGDKVYRISTGAVEIFVEKRWGGRVYRNLPSGPIDPRKERIKAGS